MQAPSGRFIVAALCVLVFAGSLGGGYVLDDTRLVRDNPEITSPRRALAYFGEDYWWPHRVSGLYRPLTLLSFSVDHAVGAGAPLVFHASNLALHAVCSLLVLALFRALGASAAVSVGGASLFAALAVHTEVVANLAGRSELLAAAFALAALLAHVRGGRLAFAAPPLFGAALLCKESAIALPLVMLLYDWLWRREHPLSTRRNAALAASLLAVALGYLALRSFALEGSPLPVPSRMDNPLVELALPLRVLNALAVAQRYLGLLLFPAVLRYDYSLAQIPLLVSFREPMALLVLFACALELCATIWIARRSRLAAFGLGLSLASFAVVSNLAIPIGTILGERLLYFPSVGFCLLVALGLERLLRSHPRALPAALALLVALNAARAAVRTSEWKSEERLYLADLPRSPNSARVQINAGFAEQLRGDHARALQHFDRALEIEPSFRDAYRNAGISLFMLGDYEQAIRVFRDELTRSPDDRELMRYLARALQRLGRHQEAAQVSARADAG
ncbi:MAG TPA: tetratricopeptide repeat protein [Myxococcota bacterium]|jgi:tetratricopeptide (TPR) repeat protein